MPRFFLYLAIRTYCASGLCNSAMALRNSSLEIQPFASSSDVANVSNNFGHLTLSKTTQPLSSKAMWRIKDLCILRPNQGADTQPNKNTMHKITNLMQIPMKRCPRQQQQWQPQPHLEVGVTLLVSATAFTVFFATTFLVAG